MLVLVTSGENCWEREGPDSECPTEEPARCYVAEHLFVCLFVCQGLVIPPEGAERGFKSRLRNADKTEDNFCFKRAIFISF